MRVRSYGNSPWAVELRLRLRFCRGRFQSGQQRQESGDLEGAVRHDQFMLAKPIKKIVDIQVDESFSAFNVGVLLLL